jgi:hypothetical protein
MGIINNGFSFEINTIASGSTTPTNGWNVPAAGVTSIIMPALFQNQTHEFKIVDANGQSAGAPITVSGVGVTINGATTATISGNYTVASFVNLSGGTNWIKF